MPLGLCVYTFKKWKSGCALVWMNFTDINYAFLNRLQIGSLWLIALQKKYSEWSQSNWSLIAGGLWGWCYLITYEAGERGEKEERERHKTLDRTGTIQLSEAGANLILPSVCFSPAFSHFFLWDVIIVERGDAAGFVQTKKTETGGVYRDRGEKKWTAFPLCVW